MFRAFHTSYRHENIIKLKVPGVTHKKVPTPTILPNTIKSNGGSKQIFLK